MSVEVNDPIMRLPQKSGHFQALLPEKLEKRK